MSHIAEKVKPTTNYVVTTHAMRRYLERVLGWRFNAKTSDEDAVRGWERHKNEGRELLAQTIRIEVYCRLGPPQRALPSVTVTIPRGRLVIEQGNRVVTCLPERGF